MKAWLERALAGEEFSVEYLHEPSGRTLMGHAAQLYDADGAREGVVVVSFDITEQKKAQNAYQALVENSLQGLALVRSGRIIFVNPRASVITGYSMEELLGLSSDGVFDLVFPADHAMVLDRIQRRQCGEDLPPLFHMRIRRKDGVIRRLLMSTSPIEFENTPVVQVAFIDVTDFPQARYKER